VLFALIRASTYSNDADSLSMPATMRQVQTGAAGGVLYVDGGWQTMVDSLATLARHAGVKIRIGEAITELTAKTILATRAGLEAFCDLTMPGWRSCVAHARFLPNLTVTHAMPELTPRPAVAFPGLNSVYVAGDWVGPEGMLTDAATASALAAASLLLERRAAA
jgi:phytoene dehydrogenase-like protein